jgi:hypothetical protein
MRAPSGGFHTARGFAVNSSNDAHCNSTRRTLINTGLPFRFMFSAWPKKIA